MPISSEEEFLRGVQKLQVKRPASEKDIEQLSTLWGECIIYILKERGHYPPASFNQIAEAMNYIGELLPPRSQSKHSDSKLIGLTATKEISLPPL